MQGAFVLPLFLGSVAVVAFLRWRNAIVDHLEDGSTVVATARGPVEYATLGEGRPLLYLHGSPGGLDQAYRMLRAQYGEAGPGFRAIIPSRPGYLRTPLSTGRTPAEQADAMAGLLDVLNIRQVAVLGASDGGPSAVQFALRYPDRCTALILWSAVKDAAIADWPLQEIRCPTLILHGKRDGTVPFSGAEAAQARIPRSRLVPLDGGHLVGLRKHREVADAIRSFLAEAEAPPGERPPRR